MSRDKKITAMIAASCCLAITSGCDGAESELASVPLRQTEHVYVESGFAFTLSPDDAWLLHYERQRDRDDTPTARTQLRLFHINRDRHYEFSVPREKSSPILAFSTACWTSDSRFYIQPGFVVDLEPQEPRLITELMQEGKVLKIGDVTIDPEDATHCSDCYQGATKRERSDRIAEEGIGFHPDNDEAILSHDGETVFFQQQESSSLKLVMRQLETGKDVVLASHSGRCPRAGYLRVSPDERLLAYQFTTGCNFVQPAKLYIIDLETKERWSVEPDVFGVMHWTSDSKRLYFAKRESYQSPMFIHYVDISEVDDDGSAESAEDDGELKPAK